jgi:hypothetical protein
VGHRPTHTPQTSVLRDCICLNSANAIALAWGHSYFMRAWTGSFKQLVGERNEK